MMPAIYHHNIVLNPDKSRMLTVADLCPYWSWPPTGGGPLRIYNMNKSVSQQVQVLQFSSRPTFGHLAMGFSHWVKSRSIQHTNTYREYQYFHPLIIGLGYFFYKFGLQSDIFLSQVLKFLSPACLSLIIQNASLIQVEHPWMFEYAEKYANGKPIVYVAHNVEADLWEPLGRHHSFRFTKLVMRTRELEKHAIQKASSIVTMSQSDSEKVIADYKADPTRITVIPNGVDLKLRKPCSPIEKSLARQRLKLDHRPVLLFMGSDHYPNKQALKYIQQWEHDLGSKLKVLFLVVGTVGRGIESTNSMRIEGFVEDVTDYLVASDVALNPLISGSGVSLKSIEYLACGLPLISTSVGVRGISVENNKNVLIGEIGEFPSLITHILKDEILRQELSTNGRFAVEKGYGWDYLGTNMVDVYRRVSSCASVL